MSLRFSLCKTNNFLAYTRFITLTRVVRGLGMSRVRFTRINSNKRTLGLLINKNNRKNFLEVRSQNDSF